MRRLLIALVLCAACGDGLPGPGQPDAGPPPPPPAGLIQPLEDGSYRVEWKPGSAVRWTACDRLELSDGGATLRWRGDSETCQDELQGEIRSELCGCYPHPTGGRSWCLCPSVHSLYGYIQGPDTSTIAALRVYLER